MTKIFSMKKRVKVYNSRSKIVMLSHIWKIWVQLPNKLLGVLKKSQFKMNINDKQAKCSFFHEICLQIMHSCPRCLEWTLVNFFFSSIFSLDINTLNIFQSELVYNCLLFIIFLIRTHICFPLCSCLVQIHQADH